MLWKLLPAFLLLGCTTDVLFIDEAHYGLAARISPGGVPLSLSAGAQRNVSTWLPAEAADTPCNDGALSSLYAHCSGNLGFNDPVRLRHTIATGAAAEQLAALHGTALRGGQQ
ncbi:MAG: hypothetical protein EXS14_04845 [Planctomycetes bacterium]|nr:hypothetical protein [Planctomycetota bacterium]